MDISEASAIPFPPFICKKVLESIGNGFSVRGGRFDKEVDITERVRRAGSDRKNYIIAVNSIFYRDFEFSDIHQFPCSAGHCNRIGIDNIIIA